MLFQVSDLRVCYMLNKSENATPDYCLPSVCKMMPASKANKSVSECSRTGLYIQVKATWKPFKCDRGPIFQVTNLNRNLT